MSELQTRVQAAIQQQRLFRRGDRIVVAVSGGVDSMVLLRLMDELAREYSWKLVVAHLNHMLRGRGSNADERLVREASSDAGLSFVSERVDVRRRAEQGRLSTEMAARQARHEFLARVARDFRSRKIALAHHADDQVELFFIRLLRGAGMDGLSGMKWSNPSPADGAVRLTRPLLGLTRPEIQAFARQHGVKFRYDPSNDCLEILRNRIRHELLPLLEKKYQPGIRSVVLRLMDLIAAESELTGTLVDDLVAGGPDGKRFDSLPRAAQRRLLQVQLIRLGLRHDYETIERLRSDSGVPFTLAPHTTIYRDEAGEVHRRETEQIAFNSQRQVVDLQARGRARFGGVAFDWRITQPGSNKAKTPRMHGRELFDADRVGPRVTLRHWQPGDRFQPIGMTKPLKLQDFFANKKVPRATRHELVVATTDQGEVFWVEDMRISERFKLDGDTRRRLEWSWHRP
jgi:tRNA(Ile)-lysidine synthase